MNTKRLLTLVGVVGLGLGLAGCGTGPTVPLSASPMATATRAAATATVRPATATASPLPPTALPPTPTEQGQAATAAPSGLITNTGQLGRGQAFQMAWSPDANLLAIGSSVGAYVLDAATLAVTRFIPTTYPVYVVRFSPDGKQLVGGGVLTADDPSQVGTVDVWNLADGSRAAGVPELTVWLNDVALDPSGTLLAVGGLFPTTQVLVWDLTINEPLYSATPGTAGATVGTSVAFSPDGKLLALAGGAEGVLLYQARSGVLQAVLSGLPGPTYDLAFSADGRRLAAGGTQQVALWDVTHLTAGAVPLTVTAESEVWHVAFSADGRALAFTSGDAVQVVETATGRPLRSLPTTDAVVSVAFGTGAPTPTELGQAAVLRAVDTGQTYTWDAQTGVAQTATGGPLSGFTGPVLGLGFMPNGDVLSSELSTMRVWDVATEQARRAWPVAAQGKPALSPDGKQVASGYCPSSTGPGAACAEYAVGVWDTSTGALIRSLPGPANTVNAVAYSPDGRWLAVAGGDGTVTLWDAVTLTELGQGGEPGLTLAAHTAAVAALAFAPDSRTLASGGYDGRVVVWDVTAGTPRTQLVVGDGTAPVFALAYNSECVSPPGASAERCGTLLATGSAAPDSTLRLWRIADGAADPNPLAELIGTVGDIQAIAFHPSGRWLVSGSTDATVRTWALTPAGAELRQSLAQHVGAVFALAFSPEGGTLVSGGADGAVVVWSVGP